VASIDRCEFVCSSAFDLLELSEAKAAILYVVKEKQKGERKSRRRENKGHKNIIFRRARFLKCHYLLQNYRHYCAGSLSVAVWEAEAANMEQQRQKMRRKQQRQRMDLKKKKEEEEEEEKAQHYHHHLPQPWTWQWQA